MYSMLTVLFFASSIVAGINGNINLFIGLAIVSALYAIASGISAIYTFITLIIPKIAEESDEDKK